MVEERECGLKIFEQAEGVGPRVGPGLSRILQEQKGR